MISGMTAVSMIGTDPAVLLCCCACCACCDGCESVVGEQGGASRLVGGTGLYSALAGLTEPPGGVSALRVTIPLPAPGVRRAGDGSWFALSGSLALPLRRCAVPAHHRRPCSVRPGVPTTT